jgi:hypothetical protein
MLLKHKYLRVSGEAANHLARQILLLSMGTVQTSPVAVSSQKLAEWIANNYAEELNVPPRPDQSRPWSTAMLNLILQTCIVSDLRRVNILFPDIMIITPDVTHSTWNTINFLDETSRCVHVHGICIVYHMYMLVIFQVYTCTDLIMLTAGLFGNYPSPSILHWRA